MPAATPIFWPSSSWEARGLPSSRSISAMKTPLSARMTFSLALFCCQSEGQWMGDALALHLQRQLRLSEFDHQNIGVDICRQMPVTFEDDVPLLESSLLTGTSLLQTQHFDRL